jgi:polar amino acid transport system substrate-binding protein
MGKSRLLRHAVLAALLTCTLALPLVGHAQEPLRVLMQELPPYAYNQRGVPEGLAVDVIKELMRLRGVAQPIEFAPLPRAIHLMSGELPAIFGPLARTELYEARFRWLGPIVSNPSVVFRRRSDLPLPQSLDLIRGARAIAVGRASVHEGMLRKLDFHNLVMTRDVIDSFKYIIRGDAEYAVGGLLTANPGLDKLGIPHALIENTGITVANLQIYLAVSRRMPDKDFEAWQGAFETMRRNGQLDKLLDKHLGTAVERRQATR